ncbi:flagellar basal body rod protein FlgB [Deferrisoma camini]|uniref:flagellar basal body rod protein FlgB n=1 Tax=Deferrisoma camini TaxID=1035120 RepID=UPI00046C924F|nr:flagellar basal body rod protein FlgB [Deferrisoma camini]
MGFLRAMDGVVGPLVEELRYRQRRQAMLAANVANADTPGYRALDVRFDRAMARHGLRLATTHPRHLGGARASGRQTVVAARGTPRRDGNDVDIDREMAKIAQNQIEYQFLTRMLGSRFRKLKEAITGRPTP